MTSLMHDRQLGHAARRKGEIAPMPPLVPEPSCVPYPSCGTVFMSCMR